MLNDFNCSCPVYIACGYTDLRRGIDGLATLVKSQFQMDPFQRALFLFCAGSRRCTGRETAFYCCISAWRAAVFNGLGARRKCRP